MSTSFARESTRQLLVVAPNWLGDLVMATVLLEALADVRQLSDGRRLSISLAVRRRWSSLLEKDPRIDTLVPWERTGRHGRWYGIWRLARDWRRVGYDSVILLPPSLRVALAAGLAGIPQRVGFRSDGRGRLLTSGANAPPRGTKHYTEEVLQLGRIWAEQAVGWQWAPPAAPLPTLAACDDVPPLPATLSGPPCWALAAGATYGEAKGWPASRVVGFVERVVHEEGVRVLLLGDATARAATDIVQRRCRAPWRRELAGPAGVVDLVGRTPVTELVALLRGVAVCVSIDSGLMHLAAALGVPTLGLFGSTSQVWTGPRGRNTRVVSVTGFSCQPCFRRRCNRESFCMDSLSAETVHAAARQLLVSAGEEGGS